MGKMFAGIFFFRGNLFLQIAGKIAKIAEIRTCKNFVPHGIYKRNDERVNLLYYWNCQ